MSPIDNGKHTNGIDASETAQVIVVGSGPVGMLLALKLGLVGIRTIVLEKHERVLEAPRAIAYLPLVNKELEKLGLLSAILKEAHCTLLGPAWRNIDKEVLGVLGKDVTPQNSNQDSQANHEAFNVEHSTLMIGQDRLAEIVLGVLDRQCKGIVQVRFGVSCVGVMPFPGGDGLVDVMTKRRTGTSDASNESLMKAVWVVGADGADSFVRKACCIPFEGFTWPDFRFTAADVEYQFDKEGNYRPINYIVDPEEWAVIARAGKSDIWRIAYGERMDLPADNASVVERAHERILRFLPKSKQYVLKRVKPFWAQQRCAKVFRKGQVILIGDAAHCNTPIGGLGLTSGLLDAVAVGNAMVRHLTRHEPDDIIDKVAAQRRSAWRDKVDVISQGNYRRLFAQDETSSRERKRFFDKLGTDPSFPAQLGQSMAEIFPDDFETNAQGRGLL